MGTSQPHPGQDIAGVLAEDYGLTVTEVERLPAGHTTVNYQVRVAGRRYFVKRYPHDADLGAEAQAIDLASFAAQRGVSTPTLVPTRGGQVIGQRGGLAVSVWEWMDGQTVTAGFTPAQQEAVGRELGRIHRVFATHPNSTQASITSDTWLRPDLSGIEATIADLLSHIAQRGDHDDFDHLAEQTLRERRHALREVPALLDRLPALSAQVLHGDFSPVNLLFDGDHLRAVTDFGPPEPFLLAYELGRIAFDPRTVVLDEDWITAASRIVTAYLEANPTVRAEDVRACARAALLQLLRSLYGLKQHYRAPVWNQTDLDDFWLLRHRASVRLLNCLDAAETALDQTTREFACTLGEELPP